MSVFVCVPESVGDWNAFTVVSNDRVHCKCRVNRMSIISAYRDGVPFRAGSDYTTFLLSSMIYYVRLLLPSRPRNWQHYACDSIQRSQAVVMMSSVVIRIVDEFIGRREDRL